MTYTPTKQEIEDAARACGLEVTKASEPYLTVRTKEGGETCWNPHLDAGDRMAMIEAIPIGVQWHYDVFGVLVAVTAIYEPNYSRKFRKFVKITNGNKQAALAEAAIKVAAQVGRKMKC